MKKLVIGMMVVCSLMATSVVAWCGDNGNGTVTVNGLVWLKDAGCLDRMNWNDAMTRPKSLAHGQCGLTDNSKPGDWRLPALDELRAIRSAIGQFKDVNTYGYWSCSTAGNYSGAWGVNVYDGKVANLSKVFSYYVWPVRGGQ